MLPQVRTKRDKIRDLIEALKQGNIIGTACKKANLTYSNLRLFKEHSHFNRLARAMAVAQEMGQTTRDYMVEDAQFKRLAEGRASGSEYEFYLTNRRTDRWKKLNEFGNTAGAPALIRPPQINYISVSVKVDKSGNVEQDSGAMGGNGNGKPRIADHV